MLKNILKLTIRHFFRQKVYPITIVLSLSIGLFVANILIGFIIHELSTDSFLTNKDRIYRLVGEDPWNQGGKNSFILHNTTSYINDNFPEVEKTCAMYPVRNNGLSKSGDREKINGLTILGVDSTFFDIFDYPFYQGIPESASGYDNIILTSRTADILFGENELPDSELSLHIDTTRYELNVSSILDLPEESHLNFDALVDFRRFRNSRGGITYRLLSRQGSANQLEEKLQKSTEIPSVMGNGKIKHSLQSLESIYWDDRSFLSFSKARNRMFVWVSLGVTTFVLFLAGYNFLSLFLISFKNRWKEFGLKKVLGANASVFLLTAFVEVGFYMIISFLISLVLTYLFLPEFNSLVSSGLTITFISSYKVIAALLITLFLVFTVVILRVSYFIYKVKPLSLVNKTPDPKTGFNNYLVAFQFSISFILLMCALLMIKQVNFINKKPLGFNRNILEVRSPARYLTSQLHLLKQDWSAIPGIGSISVCSGNPISDNMILRYDLEDKSFYTPYLYNGDINHLETLGIHLIEGEIPSPSNKRGRLVNEKFVELFDFTDPIGTIIPGDKETYITGVVRDFNCSSLEKEIPPVIISHSDDGHCLIARIDMNKLASILPLAETAWHSYFPNHPFKYLLLDDELNRKHADDAMMGKVLTVSTLLSIIITCFGIFAISWGTGRQRSKEIGIRKVIGATNLNILILLLKKYVLMISLAFIIASPIAYYLTSMWLENFAYKVDMDIKTYLLAGLIVITVTFLTIGYHTLKSAHTNPVDELKYE